MSLVDEFPHLIQAIENCGLKWKRLGGVDGVCFQCPCHNDNTPSARFWIGSRGNVVVGCFGCDTKKNPGSRLKIIDAMGLKISHLFKTERAWDDKGYIKPCATYEFFDEHGELKYRTCRYNRRDESGRMNKRFTIERYQDGGFVKGLGDTKHLLYQIPLWISAPVEAPLFWVEGEQKAEILTQIGLNATSMHGGSSQSYHSHFDSWLANRSIIFIPDQGQESNDMVYSIAGRLMLEGIAKSIKVTNIPGLYPKQDVWDWIQCRMMDKDFSAKETKRELLRICGQCKTYRCA